MKHVHLIGIGGTGLSAIATVLLESGYTVSGSDRARSPLSDSLIDAGARVAIGHAAENVAGADVIVRSSAIPDDNPEVVAARAQGIPVLKRSDFLSQLMEGKTVVAVSGTHGKTTTTAMISWMLSALGQEPSFIVGGVLKNLNTNARAGKGAAFVVEADEYDRMFLGLSPKVIVITNAEHDHPDCYPTAHEYQDAFIAFTDRLVDGGAVIGCVDDPGAVTVLNTAAKNGKTVISYAIETGADFQARDLERNLTGGFSFMLTRRTATGSPTPLARIHLQTPGEHNVLNAMAALAVAERLGLPIDAAAKALEAYQGTGRRFDVRGQAAGVTFVDDYAHHPTEIRATLAAAQIAYPSRRIWAVWQPHTYSRTKTLFDQFASAFRNAAQVVVTEIYAAREPAEAFSAAEIVASMDHPAAHFIPTLPAVVDYLASTLRKDDVVLVFSAGDADQVSGQVLERLKAKEQPHA